MSQAHGLQPIVSKKSKVLILGSLPGKESLRLGQYYAHPRNAFWPIMGVLFGAGPSFSYRKRVTLLRSTGIALWDSLRACERIGSLDSSIKDETANDFPRFFDMYPKITHIVFNGAKAEQVFRLYVLPALIEETFILARLPSTSPAHARMPLNAKVQKWHVLRKFLS